MNIVCFFKIILVSLILIEGLFAYMSLDYLEAEKTATEIYCQTDPDRCTQMIEVKDEAELPLVVDGIALPADALREPKQQESLVDAGLYLNKKGEVLMIADDTESVSVSKEKRKKLLPVKIFNSPLITDNSSSPIVITISNYENK